MNYIKRLENENKEKAVEIVGLRSLLSDIQTYLVLPKFNPPNQWVNPQDILNIIEQGLDITNDLIFSQKGLNERKEN